MIGNQYIIIWNNDILQSIFDHWCILNFLSKISVRGLIIFDKNLDNFQQCFTYFYNIEVDFLASFIDLSVLFTLDVMVFMGLLSNCL